jgi:hypothetical protein
MTAHSIRENPWFHLFYIPILQKPCANGRGHSADQTLSIAANIVIEGLVEH